MSGASVNWTDRQRQCDLVLASFFAFVGGQPGPKKSSLRDYCSSSLAIAATPHPPFSVLEAKKQLAGLCLIGAAYPSFIPFAGSYLLLFSVRNMGSPSRLAENEKGQLSAEDPPLLWGRTKEEYLRLVRTFPSTLDVLDLLCKPRLLEDESVLHETTDLTKFDLRTDLSCPICMGILQHTVVVKDCLHRFCADCIEKCVRIGIRECPQCRMHIASRRSLRPDALFDQIIRRLFPDVKEFEDKNEELIAEANKRRIVLDDDSSLPDPDRIAAESHSQSNHHLLYDSAANSSLSSCCDMDFSIPSTAVPSFPQQSQQYLTSAMSAPLRAVYINSKGFPQARDGSVFGSGRDTSTSREDSPVSSAATTGHGPSQVAVAGRDSIAQVRRKRRREQRTLAKLYPSDGKLRFAFIPDPSIPMLPFLGDAYQRLVTSGELTALQICRHFRRRLGLEDVVPLRLYTKEHRKLFSPDTTLAQLHQQSLAMSHDTLVVYYTTRSAEDGLGEVYTKGHFGTAKSSSFDFGGQADKTSCKLSPGIGSGATVRGGACGRDSQETTQEKYGEAEEEVNGQTRANGEAGNVNGFSSSSSGGRMGSFGGLRYQVAGVTNSFAAGTNSLVS